MQEGLTTADALSSKGDHSQAFALCQSLAAKGYGPAQSRLGLWYQLGRGVERSLRTGFEWYERAAETGDLEGTARLAICYRRGFGVFKNNAKFRHYAGLAGQHNQELALIWCHLEGVDRPKDSTKAAHYAKKLAEAGDSDAQMMYGRLLLEGNGVPRDLSRSLQWFTRAADQGNMRGLSSIGWFHWNGLGVPQDLTKAFNFYHSAALGGDIDAQYNLGIFYAEGSGVERSVRSAAHWYSVAASMGSTDAQYNIALLYLKGTGVPKDHLLALSYLQLAADEGEASAQLNLAQILESGKLMEQDLPTALKYYEAALAQDPQDVQARHGVARLKRKLGITWFVS